MHLMVEFFFALIVFFVLLQLLFTYAIYIIPIVIVGLIVWGFVRASKSKQG